VVSMPGIASVDQLSFHGKVVVAVVLSGRAIRVHCGLILWSGAIRIAEWHNGHCMVHE
jgi:hypothetical protein